MDSRDYNSENYNPLEELGKKELGMSCQDCGEECFEDKYPKVIYKDALHCICENCSHNYYKDAYGNIKVKGNPFI